ncbi:hypothetical protein [Pseudohaliea sp.]|uniref:hypothetical protein n=1 Tax=Pseudohaliea sp. TaxID=2740289 RepID=UPI0032EE290C
MSALRKLVALLCPGFVLTAGLAIPPAIAQGEAYRLNGADLVPLPGAAITREKGTMIVHGWTDGQAVVHRPVHLEAADYAYATIALEGLAPSRQARFAWKAREEGVTTPVKARLPWTGGGTVTIALPPSWRGTISEIGLLVAGQPGQALRVKSLTLREPSVTNWLRARRDDWFHFGPWQLVDINFLRAHGLGTAPRLVPAILAACALAAVFALIAGHGAGRQRAPLALALVIATGWLLLDAAWQRKLLLQLAVTRDTFGGVPVAERPERDIDAHLFALSQRLAPQLPVDPARRVFLLHPAKGHQYDRLKLQYHLLPRNLFNFGSSLPALGTFRTGDHVLLLGSVPNVTFDAASGVLRDEKRAVAASPVDVTEAAALYRLEAGGSAP